MSACMPFHLCKSKHLVSTKQFVYAKHCFLGNAVFSIVTFAVRECSIIEIMSRSVITFCVVPGLETESSSRLAPLQVSIGFATTCKQRCVNHLVNPAVTLMQTLHPEPICQLIMWLMEAFLRSHSLIALLICLHAILSAVLFGEGR